MDYGWDTSDEENGMQIDLHAKKDKDKDSVQEKPSGAVSLESAMGHFLQSISKVGSGEENKAPVYDPSEPTDDYDPTDPTDGDKDVSDYDPAEPTGSDEDVKKSPIVDENSPEPDGNSPNLSIELFEQKDDGDEDAKRESTKESEGDGRWNSQESQDDSLYEWAETGMPEAESSLQDEPSENSPVAKDGVKSLVGEYDSSQSHDSVEVESKNKTEEVNSNMASLDSNKKDNALHLSSEDLMNIPLPGDVEAGRSASSPIKDNKSASPVIRFGRGSPAMSGSDSPAMKPSVDESDENTQTSVVANDQEDLFSDVPDVTFDDSDFVLEKESFQEHVLSKNNDQEDRIIHSNDKNDDEVNSEERERIRRQDEIDSRNEEALVDLFREESDPEKIEEEVEQPTKKTKKKLGSKKLKKKGKKLKKGQTKKGASKHSDVQGDERYVEIRKDRHSIESREEGEVDNESSGLFRSKSHDEKMSLNAYEQVFDIGRVSVGDEEEEPGEIVEMDGNKKKVTKKKDKKEKKKKKIRREVATIEEGSQGDEDSQKYPSFLAGFFVQDEGGEEMDENLDHDPESFQGGEERHFKRIEKNYRKRHDSGAEDSLKSFEQVVDRGLSLEVRGEEQELRRNRRFEGRHESREGRNESRDTREVRRERDHRQGTPRERERDRVRSDRERERTNNNREKERERQREKDREVIREREKERKRWMEMEERRRRHSRSRSQEVRRRSGTGEHRRSRSRDRASRQRKHRTRSREHSEEREREREKQREREREERERDRSKRKHRDRSREREPDRRRRVSQSRSRSPRRRSDRASSNKENRDEVARRRRHVRAQEESESEGHGSRRGSQRRQRQQQNRSSSSSSTSSSSSSNAPHKSNSRRHFQRAVSSDDGASSDVILVEPERIVINLDELEDPPSRVDITHGNTVDDSTTVIDGESIPPPPQMSGNTRASALIQINPDPIDNEENPVEEEQDGDATPTRDEPSDTVRREVISVPTNVNESDYDPAHPTEEVEDREVNSPTTPVTASPELGPVPPTHPPPEERPPTPPPGPVETSQAQPTLQSVSGASAPPMPLVNHMFNQPPPIIQQPQPMPTMMRFPPMSGPPPPVGGGPPQRFPFGPFGAAGPNVPAGPQNLPPQNMINLNNRVPGFQPGHGLLPTPEGGPMFPVDTVRPPLPFSSSMPPIETNIPPPNMRPPVSVSSMGPLAQLTSLLGLEKAKLASQPPQQGSKNQMPPSSVSGQGLLGKAPLSTSSASNMPQATGKGLAGQGLDDSTEVIDMDMSPGEDDCELVLLSPTFSDSDSERDKKRKKRSRRSGHKTSSKDPTKTDTTKGLVKPSVYLKALSKVIEKLTPKGQVPGASASAASSQENKPSKHSSRHHKVEVSGDDDVPNSAVELTNKEKFMKKMQFQERVIDEVKTALKPFYSSKKVTKEQYKLILRKAVPKICHSKSEKINPQKIQQLVEAYVGKMRKGHSLDGSGKKKKSGKDGQSGPSVKDTKDSGPNIRQNGVKKQAR